MFLVNNYYDYSIIIQETEMTQDILTKRDLIQEMACL